MKTVAILAMVLLVAIGPSQLAVRFERATGRAPAWASYLAVQPSGPVLVAEDRVAWPTGEDRYAALRWLNVSDGGQLRPEGPRAQITDLTGRDPETWSSTPRLKRDDLYPGIDLTYRSSGSRLEYLLDVAPGVDPAQIRFRLTESSRLDPSGDLVGKTSRWRKPIVTQRLSGATISVSARFEAFGDGSFGFRLGQYDRRFPLQIDPVLLYATVFGGSGNDYAAGLEVDRKGNLYLTGQTTSLDFPSKSSNPTMGGVPVTAGLVNAGAAFVAKLSPDGKDLVFLTMIGGSQHDYGVDLYLDQDMNIYLAGMTQSGDFPSNFPRPKKGSGVASPFVLKMDGNGKRVAWSRVLGGPGGGFVKGIFVGPSNNVYIAGTTSDREFPTTRNAYQTRPMGGNDGFAIKLDRQGKVLISTRVGGKGDDDVTALAVTSDQEMVLCGTTSSADYPQTPGNFGSRLRGKNGAFLTSLSIDGRKLRFSGVLSGSGSDSAYDVTLGTDGSAYLAGTSHSPDFPSTHGAFQSLGSTDGNVFVAKIRSDGMRLLYSSVFGGSGVDQTRDVAVNERGEAFVVGFTSSADFPSIGAESLGAFGKLAADRDSESSFLVQLSADGKGALFATSFGGSGRDVALDATYDRSSGKVYVLGATSSKDFPVTANPIVGRGNGRADQDAFLAAFDFRGKK